MKRTSKDFAPEDAKSLEVLSFTQKNGRAILRIILRSLSDGTQSQEVLRFTQKNGRAILRVV